MRFQQGLPANKPLSFHDDSVAFDECAFHLPLTISVGNNTQFAYDAQDRCVKIEERTNSTLTSTKQFTWCGTERCEERDASGNVVSQFFGLGQKTSGSSFYYSRDHLGSVREVTNASGAIVTQVAYSPWGEATLLQGSTLPDFGYAGYYNHPRSGLNLTLYRAYSPRLGRWLSRDPIGEIGGCNLYAALSNDPVDSEDPLGLEVRIYASPAFGSYQLIHVFAFGTESHSGAGRGGVSGSDLGRAGYPVNSFDPNKYPYSTWPFHVVPTNSDGTYGKYNLSEAAFIDFLVKEGGLNDGMMIPWINDCHNSLEDAFEKAGVPYEDFPRLLKSLKTKPLPSFYISPDY